MANYPRTITLANGGASISQNVIVGDTITVTVLSSIGNTGSVAVLNNRETVHSVSSTSVSFGSSFVITAISTGTIFIDLVYFAGKNSPNNETGSIGGTVSAETFPSSPTAANQTISSTATSVTVPISGGSVGDAYSLCRTSGLTTNAQVVADRIPQPGEDYITAGGSFIIPNGDLPAAGSFKTYYIYRYRFSEYGGAEQYYQGNSFTVTRQTAPPVAPVISSVTHNNAAASSVTATVNLSSTGSNGTLEYAQSTSTSVPSTGWQSSASFSHPRGTTRYYWASRNRNSSGISSRASLSVGYLAADPSVVATSSTIAFAATSATTTVNGLDRASENVAVRVNNGSTNLATGTGNGSITFSSSLPSAGSSRTYEIFTRRPTSTGGDGSTWYATNDTFIVTRNPAPSISTNKSTYADGETVTVSWSTDYVGTKYYNSTGDVQVGNNRFNPKEGNLGSGFSGSFNTTAVGPSSGSWTGGFSLRLGSVAGTVIATSNTVTINAPPPVVTAPTNIAFFAAATADEITTVSVTASGGTNGTMQVSSNGSTWVANGTAFSRTRGTSQTWYARTVGTTTSGNYTESYTVPYLTGFDNNITIGSYTSTISSSNTSNVLVPYTNGGSPDQYRIRSNNTVGSSWLDTQDGSSNTFIVEYVSTSYTGTELPSNGQTFTYFIEGRRRGDTGGDPNGAWGAVTLSNYVNNTFTITRSNADTTPADFNLGGPAVDVGINTLVYSNTITVGGINAPANISISGTGSPAYSINGGTYTSSSGTVTNGQTVQVRVTSSSSSGVSVTATLNIGGVTDTFTATTVDAGQGGGGVTDPSGVTYGLQCRASNGTTVVFSPNKRFTNSEAVEISGTLTLAPDAYTNWIKSRGCHDVTRGRILTVGQASFWFRIETRSTNDGEFRVQNTSTETQVLKYIGITYG